MPTTRITFVQSTNYQSEKVTNDFQDFDWVKRKSVKRKVRSPFNVVIRQGWQIGPKIGILPSQIIPRDLIGGDYDSNKVQELVTILETEEIPRSLKNE